MRLYLITPMVVSLSSVPGLTKIGGWLATDFESDKAPDYDVLA
jgi:hypothetical protein